MTSLGLMLSLNVPLRLIIAECCELCSAFGHKEQGRSCAHINETFEQSLIFAHLYFLLVLLFIILILKVDPI